MFFRKRKGELEQMLDSLKENNYNLYILCRDAIETGKEMDVLPIFERKIQEIKETDSEYFQIMQNRIEEKKKETIKEYHRWLLVYYAIQINFKGGMNHDKSRTGI